MSQRLRPFVSAAVAILAVGAVLLGIANSARAQSSNPLAGVKLFVDRDSSSWEQWRAFERSGEKEKANLIWKIAREPRALWLGRCTRPNFHVKVRRLIDAAVAQGAVPVFTAMRAESTSCGPDYMAGGPAEDARTRDWYGALARAIGNDRVVIAFQPDSLGTIDCLAWSRRDDRMRPLRDGVDVLSRLRAQPSIWRAARRIGIRPAQGHEGRLPRPPLKP